jgi:hypothetical protein
LELREGQGLAVLVRQGEVRRGRSFREHDRSLRPPVSPRPRKAPTSRGRERSGPVRWISHGAAQARDPLAPLAPYCGLRRGAEGSR